MHLSLEDWTGSFQSNEIQFPLKNNISFEAELEFVTVLCQFTDSSGTTFNKIQHPSQIFIFFLEWPLLHHYVLYYTITNMWNQNFKEADIHRLMESHLCQN